MTHVQIERELRHELHAIVNRLGHGGTIDDADDVAESRSGDLVEDAQVGEVQSVGHLNRDRLARRARSLMTALQRLREGTYGVCEHCSEAIGPARLRALPSATTCLGCQRQLEEAPRRG